MSKLESVELQPQKRLLSRFFSKRIPHLPTEDERKPYPGKRANIIYQIFFWWLHPVMHTGYKRTLMAEDLFTLTDDLKVKKMADDFMANFTKQYTKAQNKHIAAKCKERGETVESSSVDREDDLQDFKLPQMTTVWSLFLTFKWQYSLACLYLVLANVAQTTNPLLTKRLITFVEKKALGIESGVGKGLGYSFGATTLIFIIGILTNHFLYLSMLTGAQTKALLTKALLDKSFRINAKTKHKYTTGKITSFMSTDLARIDLALGFQPYVLVFPIPIGVAIAILIVNIGVSALVGVALMIFFVVLIAFVAKTLFAYRVKANQFTDTRVNYMKELLNTLKMIKFYSWERPYEDRVIGVRQSEMKIILKAQNMRNFIIALAMSLTSISSMVSFLVLYAIGSNKRNPASIFSSISLFGVLSQQFIMIPTALITGVDALLGLTRVGEFLGSGEVDPETIKIHADEEDQKIMERDGVAIQVDDATFEWEDFDLEEQEDDKAQKESKHTELAKLADEVTVEEHSFKDLASTIEETIDQNEKELQKEDAAKFTGLHNIDLTIKKNEFVVITGLIGSGKSSLLSALSGFMKRTSGDIKVNGSLLLCGYPWVQNETVKENILFGEPYDEKRYKEVIYACSLESDLNILPAGDRTEVGERGITLSGGQKARINLARAVYAKKEIILLDDVLSAVDAGVGKHIMDNCILGLLKDSTRILATHQLSLISAADRVIFLNGDGTVDVGTFDELKARNAGFENLMAYSTETKDDEEEEEQIEDELDIIEGDDEKIPSKVRISRLKKEGVDREAIHQEYNQADTDEGRLVDVEERAVNQIKLEVYVNYINEGSKKMGVWVVVPLFLTLVVLSTFCELFANTWLSFWTSYKFKNRTNGFYIGLYIMFTMLSFILLFLQFVVLLYITTNAAANLNIKAIKRVLRAPMSFMDTTPTGRILNRFTKDTEALDNEVADQIRFLVFTMANIIGVLILTVCYIPWFAITFPFLAFIFVAITNFYQASAREIKRLEAVQRSFVYNNFNEALGGMNTIKCYQNETLFLGKNERLVDKQSEAYFITIANQRWLSINMDSIAAAFALLVSILCVCRVFSISASSTGLLLSYVFQIASQLSLLLRTYTQVENEMNSVERLSHYAYNIPEEAPYVITETTPHPSWPEHGAIKFENVDLAYRPGLPLVLKNLSFEIKASEKIGICGRTGAGKSTIMTALYRLNELSGGRVLIDDIDIATLGLNSLRSKLSIIPQDPVLFRGTIRRNLDPFDESPDDVLWDALRRAGVIDASRLEAIKKQKKPVVEVDEDSKESKEKEKDLGLHKFHLDQSVEDDGSNFSLGERQLIAVARALIKDSKILILDEATSSVDYETDSKIQQTIVREFSNCTILCIAHRLKTIIDYDKILVLDKGEIKEFDTPYTLFKTENSIFQQMCERSNITDDDFKTKH